MRNLFVAAAMAALAVAGCSSAYYGALESFGIEKREIMVDRVDDARDAQEDAAEQFADALEQYRAFVNVEAGELEKTYDKLAAEYRKSQSDAEAVSARIDDVERVAEDLFEEWQEELNDYSRAELRRDSERLLRETRGRYQTMMAAMRRAEDSMAPVLESFEDHVLVLKHNLNAQAIGALRGELGQVEANTERLIETMNAAIAEADAFIRTLE